MKQMEVKENLEVIVFGSWRMEVVFFVSKMEGGSGRNENLEVIESWIG
jgi:hypothetical protein